MKPRLAEVFDQVRVREYRRKKRIDINRLLVAMSHQDFDRIFVTDELGSVHRNPQTESEGALP
jgi:hypothetical protein